MTEPRTPTALVVGASRGLGLGLAREYVSRGWQVIATERRPHSSAGLAQLKNEVGEALEIEAVDIDEADQIRALQQRLAGSTVDLLFVNAGISDDPEQTVGEIETEEFVRLFRTNVLGPMRVVDWMSSLVVPQGVIAVMTSALGSLSLDPAGGYEVYGASKAALNKLMRSYAARAGGERRLFAVMPGWVRTDMGGTQAPLDVETSVAGIAGAIAARSSQAGLTFINYQNEVLPW